METRVRLTDVRILQGSRDLLSVPSWELRGGDRWALVGANGSGKSTLLDVVRGWRDPTEGVRILEPGLEVTFVAQTPIVHDDGVLADLLAPALRANAAAEARMHAVERRLAEEDATLEAYEAAVEAFERTGGYRARERIEREVRRTLAGLSLETPLAEVDLAVVRRASLAVALSNPGDLLLLDEPSNGLDLAARIWLIDRLRRVPSTCTVVVASHDRDLLAAVARQTAWTEAGVLRIRRMPFDAVQMERGVLRRHAKARRARMRGGTQGETPTGSLLRARHVTVGTDLVNVHLDLAADATWLLLGGVPQANTALLDVLAARRRSDAPDGWVWLRPGARVFRADRATRGLAPVPLREQLEAWVHAPRAASLLSLAGVPVDRWRAHPDALSGGERARASLALMLASEPDLLLLEEPERDLDLAGLELLEQILADSRTAAIVVTHDLRLAEAVGEEVATIVEGSLVRWRGGVEGWRKGRRQQEVGIAAHLPEEAETLPAHPSLDDLEVAYMGIEARLEDPTRLSLRDRMRLVQERHALLEARMVAYDARLAAPAPRFRAVEPPLVLEGDLQDGTLVFRADGWPSLPHVRVNGEVAHVILHEPEDACWTDWARRHAVVAVAGVVFPALGVAVLQTPAGRGAPPPPFVSLGVDWWIVTQDAWRQGIVAPPPSVVHATMRDTDVAGA